MTDISKNFGGKAPSNFVTYTPIAGVNFPAGTPVAADITRDDVVLPAVADSTTVPLLDVVLGMAISPGPVGLPVEVRYTGPITLTIAQWALITGQPAGLTRGLYYLSDTPGRMQSTPPGGEGGTVVGIAVSANTLIFYPFL